MDLQSDLDVTLVKVVPALPHPPIKWVLGGFFFHPCPVLFAFFVPHVSFVVCGGFARDWLSLSPRAPEFFSPTPNQTVVQEAFGDGRSFGITTIFLSPPFASEQR